MDYKYYVSNNNGQDDYGLKYINEQGYGSICKQYKIEFPPQHQDKQPGMEYLMTPKPIFNNPYYKASGKLYNKVAIITGGDSGLAAHPGGEFPRYSRLPRGAGAERRLPHRAWSLRHGRGPPGGPAQKVNEQRPSRQHRLGRFLYRQTAVKPLPGKARALTIRSAAKKTRLLCGRVSCYQIVIKIWLTT